MFWAHVKLHLTAGIRQHTQVSRKAVSRSNLMMAFLSTACLATAVESLLCCEPAVWSSNHLSNALLVWRQDRRPGSFSADLTSCAEKGRCHAVTTCATLYAMPAVRCLLWYTRCLLWCMRCLLCCACYACCAECNTCHAMPALSAVLREVPAVLCLPCLLCNM